MSRIVSRLLSIVLALAPLPATMLCAQGNPHPNSNRPNVLLIYVDDLNTDLGAYGHGQVQSPNIDTLARQGVLFENTYCSMALCSPSRISLMSGLRNTTFGSYSNWDGPFRSHEVMGVPILPYRFRQEGYTTGGIGKIFHDHYANPDSWDEYESPQDDGWIEQPDEPADPDQIYWGPFLNGPDDSKGKMRDTKYTDIGIDMMQRFEEPWFVAVGYLAPHRPFVYPERYQAIYDESEVPTLPFEEYRGKWRRSIHRNAWSSRFHLGEEWESDPETGRKKATAAYWRTITYVDDEIGRLMAHLEAEGLAERTIVVFVSDHGFSLGRHGRWDKASTFDDEIKTPFIIKAPDVAPARIARPVEQIDLYPTLMDLCSLTTPPACEGQSLMPMVPSDRPHVSPVFSCRVGRWNANVEHVVRTDRFKFVFWEEGRRHLLFDMVGDPGEYTNLYGDPAYDGIALEHQSILESHGLLRADWNNYFSGLSGTLGEPQYYASERPVMGSSIEIVHESSAASLELGVRLWGFEGRPQPFLGGQLNLAPLGAATFPLHPGVSRAPFTVPNDPALEGLSLVTQFLQTDTGAPQGVAFAPGLRLFFWPH